MTAKENMLFDSRNTQGIESFIYPHRPGWKRAGTSQQAADSITSEAKTLQEQVLNVLRKKELTADEVAMYLHRSILSVRPRCSELQALGLIIETQQRRRNQSGKWAAVLTIKRGSADRRNPAHADCNSPDDTGNTL